MFEKVYDTSERCFFEPCISSPHRPLPACLIVIASRSVLVPLTMHSMENSFAKCPADGLLQARYTHPEDDCLWPSPGGKHAFRNAEQTEDRRHSLE